MDSLALIPYQDCTFVCILDQLLWWNLLELRFNKKQFPFTTVQLLARFLAQSLQLLVAESDVND